MTTTDRRTIVEAGRDRSGYRRLGTGPGEAHLAAAMASAAPAGPVEVLLTMAHLSDVHVCDGQSPARAEFIDRWSDPDSPFAGPGSAGGNYRTNELLTTQVADAMVRAVNAVPAGPIGGAPIDLAITTGDVTDNAQANELSWYLQVLDGGTVHPDSGDPARYEGVMDEAVTDVHYWHPEPGGSVDLRRSRHGFPEISGLLDAAREPFAATGLTVPWLAVHGNHDRLVQGTVAADDLVGQAALGNRKVIGVPVDWSEADIGDFFAGFNLSRPFALDRWPELTTREITADPGRRITTRREFVGAHDRPGARPKRHGFAADAAATGRAWYRHDHGTRVTVLVLDTVNEHGGWQGRLDRAQFDWLRSELEAADSDRRYVVLASHHRLIDLDNDTRPAGGDLPVLGEELTAELDRHPSLVLWLDGHSHASQITAHGTWWELTAPSLIDFPQQGRIVELLRPADGTLIIAGTMLDHAGEADWTGSIGSVDALAGLSRELAANDWQYPCEDLASHPLAGKPADRNVLLALEDPFPG